MPNISESILNLSKDIGKVSERCARVETNQENIKESIERFLKIQEQRDAIYERELAERAARDKSIDAHIGQVCAFAKLGRIILKYVFPPSAVAALMAGGLKYFGIV